MSNSFSRQLVAFVVLTVLGVRAEAASVTFFASGSATNATGIRAQFAVGLADGSPLPLGTLVEFGYYTNGIPAPVGTHITQAEFNQLRAGFVKWGTNMINPSVVSGRVTNIVQNTLFGTTPPTNQIVVWIWNTSSTNMVPQTQVGVFTSTAWLFPFADAGLGNSTTITLATNLLNAPPRLIALAGGLDPVDDPLRQATLAAATPWETPFILSHPQGTNLLVGGTATLSVAVSSSTPVTYQWTKDSFTLPGATGATLVVTGASTNESGGYYVAVSNAAGLVYSQTAQVRFGYPAGIGTPPESTEAIAGGTATFSVVASGTPPFTYVWRRDGSAMSGQTNAVLTLGPVSATNMGTYSVVVSNLWGSATSAGATLTVQNAPFISQSPQGTNVVLGHPFALQVVAGGSPPLGYQWWRSGVPVAGATSTVLAVAAATTNDGGAYRAVVTGPGGVATSGVANVEVIIPARYLTVSAPAGAEENEKFDVTVLLESSGEVSGMNLRFLYPDAYLTLTKVDVAGVFAAQYAQWTNSAPGEVTLVLSAGLEASVPAGVEPVATFTFRARSVPTNAVATFSVVPDFLSDNFGNGVLGYTEVLGDAMGLGQRAWLGDNNNNGRLDPADAAYLMRLQLNTNLIRSWDVTLNDLNANSQMEVGDVTRVLRIISRLDPAVPNPGAGGVLGRRIVRAAPAPAPLGTGNARLGLTRLTGANTNKLVADVYVSGLTNGIAGVSLQVDYVPSILSITGAASLTVPVGGLPLTALKQWNVAPTNAYTAQTGTVYFSASWDSSYTPPTNVPVARIVFDILPAATAQVNVPLEVSIPASEFLPLVSGRIELSPYDAGVPTDPFGVAAEGAMFKRTFADWSGALMGSGTVTWADYDGDGQSNWLEYLASTDPRAAGSRFAVSTTEHGPGGFTVTWAGQVGVKYRVQCSTDLLTWQEVPDSRRTGAGVTESVTDTATTPGGKYYRVEVLP